MYLDYTEYVSLGGQLTETEFNRLNSISQAELDLQTFGRITEADERVKMCMFALINAGAEYNGVSSVSNDGYSITYRDASDIKTAQDDIIYKYFADTDMMYRGADGGGLSYVPQPDAGYEYVQVKSDV